MQNWSCFRIFLICSSLSQEGMAPSVVSWIMSKLYQNGSITTLLSASFPLVPAMISPEHLGGEELPTQKSAVLKFWRILPPREKMSFWIDGEWESVERKTDSSLYTTISDLVLMPKYVNNSTKCGKNILSFSFHSSVTSSSTLTWVLSTFSAKKIRF